MCEEISVSTNAPTSRRVVYMCLSRVFSRKKKIEHIEGFGCSCILGQEEELCIFFFLDGNIWCPSFLSSNGPLTGEDSVMRDATTAMVVVRNLLTPRDNNLLSRRSDELAVLESLALSVQCAGSVSNMGQRLLARTRQVESLTAEVENLRQEIRQLKRENRDLHMLANNYSTSMKRKLDQLQESEGRIQSDHQRFVAFFQMHLLPSSSSVQPSIEVSNNLSSMPPVPRVSPRPNLNGTEQFIHRINLRATMDIKSHIEGRISKCPLEDLALLKEDLSKLISAIANLNVDSSSLKIKVAELMATSTEYSSLRAISSKKLSPDVRAHQLAAIDLSLTQVQSSQQAALGDYQATETSLASVQVRLDTLIREQEQLGIEASRLKSVLEEQGATLSQCQEEISRLEQEKDMATELPILSLIEVETLKTLEGLLEDRLRNFRDIVFE
ncbi:S ribonuclease [Pyrus ussuriensis x Pyrus communis]|uniref:S ribonuclease n=1 Tax=Pyrus ussuriensis x Pyrus communis TaxID=2448454 RepID=A0A5N5G7S3_9ROSA|nr:S ribonuclease [Pyrus ussuriensis x Pyrus communis]